MHCRLILLFTTTFGQAFPLKINGVVLTKGTPMHGVLIYVAHHQNKFTVSDSLGCFSISDVRARDSIVFSFISHIINFINFIVP